ncbi:MAG TPA: pyroglutamyl-peptidase I [Xanthobacteraceae bacterium]
MTATILLTGFGPFPGAPFNPTGPLVVALARHRRGNFRNTRRIAHVFATSYRTVDQELPALLARERPDALVMFGLAARSRHIRIETRARNALTGRVADAYGHVPTARMIAPGERATRRLRVPAPRLVAAVRAGGASATLSHDAGDYLCNYLCWRAGEAAERDGGPRLVAFVHVPNVHRTSARVPRARQRLGRRPRPPAAFADLVLAGEAILRAVQAALRC